MKNTCKPFVIAASLLLFGACRSNTSGSAGQPTTPTADTSTSQGETSQEIQPMISKSVTGEVKEIQHGKDGYTAKIVATDKTVYFATISHANLKENAHQYRDVKVGEMIQVKGDSWKMGDENHLTVRELK